MNRYEDYLARWQRHFGETETAVQSRWHGGRLYTTTVYQHDEETHNLLWETLLEIWDDWASDAIEERLAMALMGPLEYDLLIRGYFFGPQQIVLGGGVAPVMRRRKVIQVDEEETGWKQKSLI